MRSGSQLTPMRMEFLTDADRVLGSCGRLISPPGGPFLHIPVQLQYSQFLPAGSADSTQQKIVETPVPFVLRSFQAFAEPASVGAVYWRLRFPNGRFFNSTVCAVTESFNNGSYRSPIDPPLVCEPGSRFFITTDNLIAAASSDVALTVLLEGYLQYTLKAPNGQGVCEVPLGRNEPWASLPMFRQDPNGNILAPEWRLCNQCYPETPAGYRDEQFANVQSVTNAFNVPNNGQVSANNPLFIGSDSDFVVRALDFVQTPVSGATGILFVRIRDYAGYELTDGFTYAARISSVLFPELWLKTSNTSGALFYDFMYVDTNNTGSFNVQPVAFGVKRRKVG